MSARARITSAVAVGLGCVVAVGLGASSAAAAPATADRLVAVPLPVTRTYESPMQVTGIDRELAEKAGNRVRTENGATVLYDGRSGAELARVPVGGGGGAGRLLRPQNTVVGNCGSSYITITWLGGSRYNVWTGFHLNRRAIAWTWAYTVRADDDRGVYHDEWSNHGRLGLKYSWAHVKTDTTDHRGDTHVARVTRGIAIAPTGVVCSTGYPTDAIYIPR